MFKDKAFQYMPESDHVISDKRRISNNDSKKSKPGRIRVQAGDKCVPPSKSRPKKRKAVGPQDESTLNMECVQWSDQIYTVKSLLEDYSHRFPLLVKAEKGYSGQLLPALIKGQVLQIHSWGKQKRVSALDSQKRQWSIPVTYPLEVTVLEVHDRVWMTMKNVAESRMLPVRVRVMNISNMAEYQNGIVGEDLELYEIKEELFLRGNSIMNGWINQLDITMVPSFLDAKFAVAVGMKGATFDEWNDFQGMYARSIRHLNFQLIGGYQDIYIDCESPYPLNVKKEELSETKSQDTIFSNTNSTENISQSEKGNILYENLPGNKNDYEISIYNNPSFIDDEKISNQFLVKPVIHQISRPETPFSEVDESDVQTMFDNVIEVGQETVDRQDLKSPGENILLNLVLPSDIEYNTQGENLHSQSFPKLLNVCDSISVPFSEKEQNIMLSSQGIQRAGSYISETSSGTPMGVIQPTILQSGQSTKRKSLSSFISDSHTVITSMDDVPASIIGLTVEEVCSCLHLLNMDYHIPEFKNHQIDGKLLNGMKENLLLHEFHFTPFNASKLMRFIRGWRPKFI